MKILLIDDDKVGGEVMARLFGMDGHTVDQVTTGASALMTVGNPPDAVILDYILPDVDGITLMRQLRSHEGWDKVPVVMVTGDSEVNIHYGTAVHSDKLLCVLLKPV